MAKKPRVSIVIPSWNSEKQLKQNLRYVYKAAEAVKAEIVIVDDASSFDDSAGFLKTQTDRIRFYRNHTNRGFSYTVNRGVHLAKGDIIVLLNTDVRPSQDCFVKCLPHFRDDTIFAVTFNSGEAWMGGEWKDGLFQHFKVEPNKDNGSSVNPSLWASGGQAAFAKDKWNALKGMDLLFKPFYWEDTDLGFRAWKRGWRVIWAPECKVVHDHQKSVIATNFSKKFIMDTAQRNQFLFIWKNISDPQFLLAHFLHLPMYFLKYPLPVLRATLKLSVVLRQRRREKRYWKVSDREILRLWAR